MEEETPIDRDVDKWCKLGTQCDIRTYRLFYKSYHHEVHKRIKNLLFKFIQKDLSKFKSDPYELSDYYEEKWESSINKSIESCYEDKISGVK